mgnify:CR=1 FL=1
MEDNKISILKKDKTKKDKSKGVTIPPIEYYKKKIKSSPKKKINLSKKKFSQDEADSGNNIKDFLITESNVKQYKLKGNEIRKFENIYSPRTSFIIQQENEEKLLQDLGKGFDPISIKIMKSFFKERLGEINKEEFIGLLQNNLLTWHPELPNRDIIIQKLASKIFEDIDLNNNKLLSWDELMDFVMSATNNFKSQKNYDLKSFIPLKKIIDDSEYTDIVSHAFYIEKYNLIGIVVEGKSYILFYDGENCKKQKAFIDVKETQQKIDQMKIKELGEKAIEKLERKEELKLLKLKNNLNLQKIKGITTSIDFEKNSLKNKKFNLESIKLNKKREETPEKIKREIKNLNSNYKNNNKKDFNKKLTILSTIFVNEYDILFVSSSNNKISAWKYEVNEFKNINKIESEPTDKFNFTCAILDAELPQQTLEWDPLQKILFSGQADGKILMWDINKSKNLENSTLDYEVAKKNHDDDLRKNRIINVDDLEVKNDNYDDQTIKEYLNKITDIGSKKNNFEKVIEKVKRIKLYGDNAFMTNKIDFSLDNVSVSCIKFIEKMQFLAAGYYNGTVILWDTILKEHRKFYTDQKTGIYQIEYDISKNLIFTCGFDHDIYIYDPYVDSRCVHKLRGHNYSINSIVCINSGSEFISIDIYGNIKIWDLSNFYNYQTINLNETLNLFKIKNNQNQTKRKISSNQKMIYLSKVKKILTFGEKLMMFGMVSTKLSDLCDTQLVLGCFYKSSKFNFYTICLKKIKVWNIFNGKLKYVFDDFLPNQNSEITAFSTDNSLKKLFIGDCLGNLLCLNLNTGKVLKAYESHKNEIVALYPSQKSELLISLDSNSVIKIHKDEDFNDNHMIKEFSLENNYIKCIKINDTFSRIIMGTSKGELKYFDIEHLKLDTSLNQKNDEKSKSKEDDPINEIYSFDNYPLCLAFHESANNIFEIIPPTYYKYRTFGKFKNIINKDNVERNVKITACEYDKENMILFTGDLFGYVHCYNLKDLIDNVKYLNHNESSKDDIQYLNNLENLKIEKIFSFEACREKIIHINYPDINPNIIIITGSDRRVKLFLSENGTYIDEFKQSSENAIIYPIGLKYYYSDPFISKINSEEELKYDFIYRKDITNFKMNKVTQEINNMKATHKPLYDYINSLIKLNAKERLYLMTKNADIPFDKSSSWKFEPNIEIINNKLRKLSNIDIKDKVIYEYNPIDSKNYYPKFINYMDPEKMKDFSDMVNNKIRKVQLNLAKIDLNNKKFNQYEKEHSNKMHYSYNKNRNFNILLDDTLKKKDFDTGKNSQKKDFIRNKFDRYKYDIEFRLKDLNNMFETKIFNRYNLLQDNKTNEKKYLLTSNNLLNRKKLPKINKERRDNINQENKNNQ